MLIKTIFSVMKNVRFNINETIVVIDKSDKKMSKGILRRDLFLLIMVNLNLSSSSQLNLENDNKLAGAEYRTTGAGCQSWFVPLGAAGWETGDGQTMEWLESQVLKCSGEILCYILENTHSLIKKSPPTTCQGSLDVM